jgi:hypothetical protein
MLRSERISSEDASSDTEEPIDPEEPLLAESNGDYLNHNHHSGGNGNNSGVGMVRVGSREAGASISPLTPQPPLLPQSLNNATSSSSSALQPLPLLQQQQQLLLPFSSSSSPQTPSRNMGDAEWHLGARRLALIALCGTLDGMVKGLRRLRCTK